MKDNFPVYRIVTERRTIRCFKQDKIPDEILKKLINAGRLAPSGFNFQPIEYIIVNNEALVNEVFKNLTKWAGYITPKGNPKEGEKPTAYIIVLVAKDNKPTTANDVGAAIENILLTAWEEGIGACWMGLINIESLREIFKIPDDFLIDCVIALGYKGENPVVEEYKDSVKYWKDNNNVLHVPKKNLKDILHWNKF